MYPVIWLFLWPIQEIIVMGRRGLHVVLIFMKRTRGQLTQLIKVPCKT